MSEEIDPELLSAEESRKIIHSLRNEVARLNRLLRIISIQSGDYPITPIEADSKQPRKVRFPGNQQPC